MIVLPVICDTATGAPREGVWIDTIPSCDDQIPSDCTALVVHGDGTVGEYDLMNIRVARLSRVVGGETVEHLMLDDILSGRVLR